MTLEKLKLKMQLYRLEEKEKLEKYKENQKEKYKEEEEKEKLINESTYIEYLDDLFINKCIYKCSLCQRNKFNVTTTSKTWKENTEVCVDCWDSFNQERQEIWDAIRERTGQYNCSICNKTTPKDRHHYDHLSCFDKTECISDMVYRGENFEKIMEEVNKCQLVCVSCHSMITKFEHKYSLIATKKKINSVFNKEDKEEQYLIHKELFKIRMEKIYDAIRKTTQSWDV